MKKPILAASILEDFGPRNSNSRDIIIKFYQLILGTSKENSKLLFQEWKQIFSKICAYSISKMEKLINFYELTKQEHINVEMLMFSIHTYYYLLIRLFTSEIVSFGVSRGSESYLEEIEYKSLQNIYEMKECFIRLENGEIFSNFGINNFHDTEYFSWYLNEWDEELAELINKIIKNLLEYELVALDSSFGELRDLFKNLYQQLVPEDVRKKLGEFFTPDWLAELLLDEIGFTGELNKSILDPTCGSGTFLVLAIKRVRDFAIINSINNEKLFEAILNNVKGIDLNPLAVQATKANFLFAISSLLAYRPKEGFNIPVYLADALQLNLEETSHPLQLIGKYDFVVGNPPWINIEGLAHEYRGCIKDLWDYYNISKTIGKGSFKRDISMLFTAVSIHKYLKDNGKYAFLLPYTVFKSQAGSAFRSFLVDCKSIDGKDITFKIIKLHDLVELDPFPGATNRAAMLIIEKGLETQFPIPLILWKNYNGTKIKMQTTLKEVKSISKQFEMLIKPIDSQRPETPWITGTTGSLKAIQKVFGESIWYKAHEGVLTGFNQVFWVDILSEGPNGLKIKNSFRSGYKKKVEEITTIIEKELIYPLIRGRDVKKWYLIADNLNIIIPHTPNGKPIDLDTFKTKYPLAFKYFTTGKYKDELLKRQIKPFIGNNIDKTIFYQLDNIGPSTFKEYKVVWNRISGNITGKALSFCCAVISTKKPDFYDLEKPLIPNDALIMLSFTDRKEAYYVSGILNSSLVLLAVASYTYELRMETHIADYVKIPKFEKGNTIHEKIADLALEAHSIAKLLYENQKIEQHHKLIQIQNDLDNLVASIYNISEQELFEIKNTLSIFKEGSAKKKP